MVVYFIILGAAVVFGIPLCNEKRCGKWGRIIYCAVFAALFTFISAARFQVGYDYNSYGAAYYKMQWWDFDEICANRMEKGFLLPFYILSLSFDNYLTAFIFTSLIIYPPVFAFIYKNSSCPWISVCGFLCFGMFFNSLCFLRQFIAAIIVTYAMNFIDRKIPVRFFILTVAASAFHWSALLMLVLCFLLRIKPSIPYLCTMTALTIIFCIFSRTVMQFVTEKFYMYRGYNPETSGEASQGLPARYTIMFGIFFVICFLFRKKLMEKNPRNGVYINCLMYTVIFEAMGMRHAILSRFALLVYLPPALYLLPDAAEILMNYAYEKKGDILKKVSGAALAVYGVGCYLILMLNNYNGVVPYTFHWDRPHDIFVEIPAEFIDDGEDYDEEDEVYDEDDEYYDEGDELYDEDDEYYDEDEENVEITIDELP